MAARIREYFQRQRNGPSVRTEELSDPAEPGYAEQQQRRLGPIAPAFVEPEQLSIWNAMQQDDLCKAMYIIRDAEKKAPNPRTSRILELPETQDALALYLLAQPSRDIVEAVLDNTLPQRALRDLDIRQPGEMHTWRESYDPVIYLNYLADENGKGLTCDEYELFLESYLVAAGVKNDTTRAKRRDLQAGIDVIWRTELGNKPTSSFFNDVSTSIWDAVKATASSGNELLSRARAAHIDHVMFKAEVGWSSKGYERCQTHRKLQDGSPDAFRLAHLLVRHLYPLRKFHLHQFYLFDIVRPEQAGIGESIASQMCTSYVAYGGFNGTQAGISVNEVWKMTSEDWRIVRTRAEQKYSKFVGQHLRDTGTLYATQLQDLEVSTVSEVSSSVANDRYSNKCHLRGCKAS
jgi:hypothetical protein